jgi:hypothetical protein
MMLAAEISLMSKFQKGNQVGRQWKPGQSGNLKGKPPIIAEVRELARKHTRAAIKALVRIVKNEASPPAATVAAASALLDRGWGRPEQSHQIAGNGLVLQVITGILRAPDEPLLIESETLEDEEAEPTGATETNGANGATEPAEALELVDADEEVRH